jgi:excisionase family DNA binding protein
MWVCSRGHSSSHPDRLLPIASGRSSAEVLSVSRPHLIKLLDRGELSFHRVGTHRRIKIEDALAYRERRDTERRATLAELTRLSEELPGGYR